MVISHWLLCQIADGSDGRETRGGGGGGVGGRSIELPGKTVTRQVVLV